jgi:hypothetical protein
MEMYAKIFSQIFDSSIAENYEVRHVFEDLLKLCDRTGVVDMTVEAVARRTNAPLEKVKEGIEELMKPDPKSRSHLHEGRRLLPLDSHRDWGWVIANYDHYRAIQDAESLRENWRDAKARQRSKIPKSRKGSGRGAARAFESVAVRAHNSGNDEEFDSAVTSSLPPGFQ